VQVGAGRVGAGMRLPAQDLGEEIVAGGEILEARRVRVGVIGS